MVCRIGEDTHRIKLGPRKLRERHGSQLRACEMDICEKHVLLDYTAHETDSDDNYAELDDYTVKKNLAQRPSASAPGGVEFNVCWQSFAHSHDT